MAKPSNYACEACHSDIVQTPGTGRIKRFCSPICRGSGRYWKLLPESLCKGCGKGTGSAARLWCEECRQPIPRVLSNTYYNVHKRLRKTRGKATDHVCPCGKQAAEWSYNHTDPNELTGATPRGITTTYSLDFTHYTPLCRSCHVKKDQAPYPLGLRISNDAKRNARLAKVQKV